MFILLLSFISSLACVAKVSYWTKCVSVIDEPYLVRPTLIDFNPVQFKYCPFMISLEKSNGSENVLSPKICVPKETKDITVKVFDMIKNKNEAKTMKKHFMQL